MRNAILNRISTRTFKDESLSKSDIEKVIKVLKKYENVSGPFGHSFEFTFNLNNKKETNGKKIGTYGLLRNVPAYIGGVCENSFENILDFGFVFEKIILELTMLDLGTCWLGGTFKRKDYRRKLEENEIIPAISPVGYKAEKRSFVDRALRSAAQSNNRKSDDTLFFDYATTKPLSDDYDIVVKQSLCLVKRGPSASNKQPWRAFVEGQNVHFYIERTPGYAKPIKYDIQMLDMGIGLSHFDVGVDYFKKKKTYNVLKDMKKIENMEYVLSVIIE